MIERVISVAVERGSTSIPLDQVMSDGNLDFYDDVIAKGYFTILLKRNKLELTAGNHVGFIPLNTRVALLVEPKVARENWLYIVGKARGHLKELNYLRQYSRSEITSTSVIEFLARAFLLQLSTVGQEGFYLQYKSKQEITSFPKGRILFSDSIRYTWSRGRSQAVAVKYYRLTNDIAHNRLLKYALTLSLSYLQALPERQHSLNQRMTELEDMLSSIPLDTSLSYLPEVVTSLEQGTLPGFREYYYDICKTAILIVENSGLSPTLKGKESTLSFVVNMETTFQDYCFEVLKENAVLFGEDIKVLHEPEGAIKLFQGTKDNRNAEPDIVIQKGLIPSLIIEVKYKDDPDRHDINQAVTYASAYNHDKVVLLCFAGPNRQQGWSYLGKVGHNIAVWVYRLDLETNIEAAEQIFIHDVAHMIVGTVILPK